MTADLTIVIPVWDQHTQLLPRCLDAINSEPVRADLVLVDNASTVALGELPASACLVTLPQRHSIGAARNAGLAHVNTPYVMFADADDEITPGSIARSLALLQRQPAAPAVLGRSIVDEHGHRRRGRNPSIAFRLAAHHAPSLAALFWLAAFQGSITSTVLRTATVRNAGGFADSDSAEDWQLAARLARRGPFICIDEPVRIYHRHPDATRIARNQPAPKTLRHTMYSDCITDPQAPATHRLIASLLRQLRKAGLTSPPRVS